MKAIDIPARFPKAFGAQAGGAYIRTIPEPSQIGIQDGAASLTDGFPPVCFTPVGAGGTPPFGQDFNGLLNQITRWTLWGNAGGPVPYNLDFATAIAGYPAGTVLMSAVTVGLMFLSIADDNATDPDAGGAGWVNLADLQRPVRIVTSSATLNLNCQTDGVVGLNRTSSPAAMVVNLAAAGSLVPGKVFRISDLAKNFDTFPVTVVPPATHLIAGDAQFIMNVRKQSAAFAYFGSNLWDLET